MILEEALIRTRIIFEAKGLAKISGGYTKYGTKSDDFNQSVSVCTTIALRYAIQGNNDDIENVLFNRGQALLSIIIEERGYKRSSPTLSAIVEYNDDPNTTINHIRDIIDEGIKRTQRRCSFCGDSIPFNDEFLIKNGKNKCYPCVEDNAYEEDLVESTDHGTGLYGVYGGK